MLKREQKPRGRDKLPEGDAMVPLPLRVHPSTIEELENIGNQTGQKKSRVAEKAMKMGIELIYKDGEVKPLKKPK